LEYIRVSYPHPFNADQDPGFEIFEDPDLDPGFEIFEDPDLDPGFEMLTNQDTELNFFLKVSVFYLTKSEKRTLAPDQNAESDPGTPKHPVPDPDTGTPNMQIKRDPDPNPNPWNISCEIFCYRLLV